MKLNKIKHWKIMVFLTISILLYITLQVYILSKSHTELI
jgi:hypothetical protein